MNEMTTIDRTAACRSVSTCRLWCRGMLLLLLVSGCLVSLTLEAAGPAIDFSRDIQPILSQHCFSCHGPDESSREAGLRLDRADAALAELESGATAIVAGQPELSELVARITAEEDYLRMPPASSGHSLSKQEIARLKRWVAEGAKYTDHWSFRPIAAVPPPAVADEGWIRNPVDRFVLARLEQAGVAPSPEADRATLLRRLSLDLLGLPPDPDQLTEFENDTAPDAYERLVDRLLASPHFGERWGRHWLDLAHYADSDGYLGDALRPNAWLYRDWVIDAVNRDLPFDEFTIEQLAGDLLPTATLEQKTATGFLRNTLRNTEAGVDLEEYRLKEIVDRVSTVGIGWLGLSVGCAECHSHKFDPISHREFYQLFSFFNNADDVDVAVSRPDEDRKYQAEFRKWSGVESQLAGSLQELLGEFELPAASADSAEVMKALATETRKRSTEQKKLIEQLKSRDNPALKDACETYERHALGRPKKPSFKAMTVSLRDRERVSYVHLRGDYRSRGDDVRPATPAVLHKFQPRGQLADRLDLARWLMDDDNPLTPRVTANRIWLHLFGRGLVATVDNFGSGGTPPSHPELLDWLAGQQRELGWSRKALIKLIVTSATYRQSSHQRPELEERDPFNELLARQQRFRLEAETIRDMALDVSGLLEVKLGGPGIRPPQPAYVTSISRNAEWKVTTGADLYRRGMYILFRRATPYPMLLTFDTPDSTVACVQRQRSNSPLQALTLLNDPVFFECAQSLGQHLARSPAGSLNEQLQLAVRHCLGRDPRPGELPVLQTLYADQHQRFLKDASAAREVIGGITSLQHSDGADSTLSAEDQARLAAWTVTARVLMNLDEFFTRE